jgi:hypothetical protein
MMLATDTFCYYELNTYTDGKFIDIPFAKV